MFDDDLNFDSGDMPTQELVLGRAFRFRRGGGPPLPRLFRLLAVVILTIVVTVVLALLIGSATATSRFDRYRAYLKQVTALAADSQGIGAQTSRLLTSATNVAAAFTLLGGLERRQQQDLARLTKIGAPQPFRDVHADGVDVFALRVTALSTLHALFAGAAVPNANSLAQPVQWLLASDVNWENLFQARVSALLGQENLKGFFPPPSRFLPNEDLATSSALASTEARLQTFAAGSNIVLTIGDHGQAVLTWQTELDRWLPTASSHPVPVAPDGNFGAATAAATRSFQQAQGLSPDGIVGPKTRQALLRALAQPG